MKTPNMDKSKEESVVLLSVSKPMENNNTLENGDFHPFEYEKKLELKNGELKTFDIEKTLEAEGAEIKSKSRVPLIVAGVCVGCAIVFATIAVVVIVTKAAGTTTPPVPFNHSTTVTPSTVSVSVSSSSITPTPSSNFTTSSIVTSSPVSQTSTTSSLSPSVSVNSVSPTPSSRSSSSSISSTQTSSSTSTVSVKSSSTVTPTKSTVISTSPSKNSVTTATVTVEITTPKPACNATQFQCLDGSCIDRLYVCDGLPTCPTAEDEDENCVCSDDQFRCASGQCIPKNLRCDGTAQCFDLSDEVNCSNCQGFQCNSGLCLWAHSFRCNDHVDCPDLSDEMACPWRPGYGECDNGLSVPWSHWCDGVDDCFDNTDENDCEDEVCNFIGERQCPDRKTCVLHEWWCDGHFDCPGGMDEVDCGSCGDSEWQCSDHTCISEDAVCNGIIDCPSRDDESNCLELKDSGNLQQTSGLVLVKSHDEQLPVCSSDWSHDLSDHVCEYLGYESSSGFTTTADSGSLGYMAVDTSRLGTSLSRNQTVLAVMRKVPSCSTNKVINVSCKPKVCGERKVTLLTPFIVGGTLSPLGKWPWVVSISFLGKDICGGVLVRDRWVLTAAHCIVSGSFNYTMLPFNFEVTAGSVYRKRSADNSNDIHRQMFKVDKIIVNPNTVKLITGVMDWDMALLQLDKPVVYGDYVQPVCLPNHGESFPTKSLCYLAGWGFINPQQETVDELREAKMRLWGEEDCGRNTVNGESHVNTNSTLCAGYSTGLISACQGDSGGPLMCADTNGHWTVAGVMSSGSQGCDGQQFNQANRFAKVSASSNWIHSVIEPS